jgi:phage shock protein E
MPYLIALLLFIQQFTHSTVSKNEFQKLIDQQYVLIDVRTAEEFDAGTIQGALLVDVKKDDFIQKINRLNKQDTLLLFCRSGRRSTRAAQIMDSLGFKHLFELGGGYLDWTGATKD